MLLAVLFWVARKLRLTVPLLYALTIPTLFRLWYLTHVQLAEVIFFGLLAVSRPLLGSLSGGMGRALQAGGAGYPGLGADTPEGRP